MSTQDLVNLLSDIRSFAKEIRTPELKQDAVNSMVKAMRTGLLGRIALIEGQPLRDMLATFFMFANEEHNAFMADVVDDACIVYSSESDKNIRRIIIGALLKSNHKDMSGVQDAIDFFCGDLGVFRRKIAA
ncbi:MAG: hypothetical protein QG580_176 [Patescibacteria group bacterium]|jgi:Flp pilus assembly CpaF family ATPase|nr:hypothetical protein [Patescibacteria group bacterium]